MKHSVKKIKVRGGKDANKMLVRKLAMNLLTSSKIVTTDKKARILKSFIERIINKAKTNTEANKNVLLQYFPKKNIVEELFTQTSAVFAKRTGGYVRIIRLNQRANDGAMMTQVEWVEPITFDFTRKAAKSAAKPKAKNVKVTKDNS